MTLWLVRAGRYGEREDFALENKVAVIGWDQLGDLSTTKNRSELKKLLETHYPDEKVNTRRNWESQLWQFINEIKPGDLIALPLKHRAAIVFGEVTGPYQYSSKNPDGTKHTHAIKNWVELPRNKFDQDMLYSLGAASTVCSIHRNNAEERIRAILGGRIPAQVVEDIPSIEEEVDLEQVASDEITEFITRKFKGHGLARLTAAVLEAQGYKVKVSPEGADGGVDILAGAGPLGFDQPRMVVQVKSGDAPVDVKVFRELHGVLNTYGAETGLLVAWNGYRGVLEKEAANLYFKIRLWDAGDLVQMVLENYEKMPASIQTELPLKQIWTLVKEED